MTWGRAMLLACLLAVAPSAPGAPGPAESGPDLPPRGHSRFDELIGAGPVPFPFARLVARIESQLAPADAGLPPIKSVLIPLGRSLQRGAGAPDFFAYPRVVLTVDGATRPGIPPMKDRLFIGYHEKGAVLEVISYNEALGRFEYQLVRDYRPGGTPELVYARRGLCLACHQNGAPIFARPLWDETPANPAIARALAAAERRFYGLPMGGTDIAYLFDAATDRANLLPLWQRIWQEGCGPGIGGDACRQDLFAAALRQALSGMAPPPQTLDAVAPRLAQRWRQVWPRGLAIPDPDLPNRDPLADGPEPDRPPHPTRAEGELAALPPIPARFDPLNPRPPLEVWNAPDKGRIVTGLAGLFADADLDALDRILARTTGLASQTLALDCALKRKAGGRVTFRCEGPDVALEGAYWPAPGGRQGRLDHLGLAGAPAGIQLRQMSAPGHFKLLHGPRAPRLADGRRLAALHVAPKGGGLTLVDDAGHLRDRLPGLAATHFPAWEAMAALLDNLGARAQRPPSPRLPAPRADQARTAGTGVAGDFRRHCGQCHDTPEAAPPNFLHGDARTVAARLAQCAPRIVYRLSMWDLAEAHRGKSPMPPLTALAAKEAAAWPGSSARRQLLDQARKLVSAQGQDPERVIARPFEALPPCLPASLPATPQGSTP